MYSVNVDRCTYCGAENTMITDFSAGQVVCSDCGVVHLDRLIDEAPEWRNFSSENPGSSSSDPNRIGGPINPFLDEVNLGLTICTTKRNGTYSRWQNRSLGSGGRSLTRMFKKLDELALNLDLKQNIIDKSKDILNNVEKNKKLKGRNLNCIIASVFFLACRACGAPRTIKDLVQSLNLEKKDVSRCFNAIKAIGLESNEKSIAMNSTGLVNLYCNKLEAPIDIKKLASEIVENICEKEIIAGRTPATIATVSIFLAAKLKKNEKITKKEINEISKVAENTIQSAFIDLMAYKDSIIPESYKELMENLKNG